MSAPINRITRDDVSAFERLTLMFGDEGPNMLNVYQALATKSAIYPGQGTALGVFYCALKLNGEAGELAEHAGKAMRVDKFPVPNPHVYSPNAPTPDRREAIIKELGDVLWYISAIAKELDLSLAAVAYRNLEKLCDRGERDALRGSGDER